MPSPGSWVCECVFVYVVHKHYINIGLPNCSLGNKPHCYLADTKKQRTEATQPDNDVPMGKAVACSAFLPACRWQLILHRFHTWFYVISHVQVGLRTRQTLSKAARCRTWCRDTIVRLSPRCAALLTLAVFSTKRIRMSLLQLCLCSQALPAQPNVQVAGLWQRYAAGFLQHLP